LRIPFSAALLISLMINFSAQAQKKAAFISGKILDENENGLGKVSIIILGKQNGIVSSDSGIFRIKVPAEKAFALQFSFTGYRTEQRNFLLNENEHEQIVVRLERNTTALKEVVVTDQRDRNEAGLIKINPKDAINIPTPNGGVESLIKIFVGSNNELTSQYSVRGGSYDENLIYINDFEVFRPYLVSNAQQEGLSIINPDLTKNVSFYNGGFQAKYGDKMSSVLDIQYKRPKIFAGTVYMGLLEQGFHVEGTDNKFSYLVGVRNFTNSDLRVTSARIMGIESDHRTLARVLGADVASQDGGPIENITGIQGVAESIDPPNNNGYERTLCWTRIQQAVDALTPFVDMNAAKAAGFDISKSFGFTPFTPALPNPLGDFISFKGC